MTYPYDYGYGYAGPDEAMMEEFMMEMMGGVGVAILGVLLVFLLAALAVSVLTYVFSSVGLYTIAKRRGIRNAWLAWLPVLRDWILGSISDQYQYVVRGRVKNKRVLLLVFGIAITALSLVANVVNIGIEFMDYSAEITGGAMAASSGLLLVVAVVSIVYAVFYYMAMYDLYTSCAPRNNVLFLVLSIIFHITEPFFLFFNRNKDDGMPPRREEPQPRTLIPEPAPYIGDHPDEY